MRLHVVDDYPDNVESLAMLLRIFGHEVATAYIGAVAIQSALRNHPDVFRLQRKQNRNFRHHSGQRDRTLRVAAESGTTTAKISRSRRVVATKRIIGIEISSVKWNSTLPRLPQ